MSDLTADDVAYVARLARLALSAAELERYTGQLRRVLEHASDIEALDLEGLPATAHPFAGCNVVREDEPAACLDRQAVLAQAPAVEQDRFAVPRIIGESP